MTDDDERRDVMINRKKRKVDALMRDVLTKVDPVIDILEKRLDQLAGIAVMASEGSDKPLAWRWVSSDPSTVPVPLSAMDWPNVELANDYANQHRDGVPTPISLLAFGDMPVTGITGATVTLGAALHTETWSPDLVMGVLHAGTRLIGMYRGACQRGDPLRVRVELAAAVWAFADGIRSDRKIISRDEGIAP